MQMTHIAIILFFVVENVFLNGSLRTNCIFTVDEICLNFGMIKLGAEAKMENIFIYIFSNLIQEYIEHKNTI